MIPLEAVIVDQIQVPVYVRIAERANHLRELGMSDKAIGRALGTSNKTVAKAIGATPSICDSPAPARDRPSEGAPGGIARTDRIVADQAPAARPELEASVDDERIAYANLEQAAINEPAGPRRTVR